MSPPQVRPLLWREGALYALDQRLLPHKQTYVRLDGSAAVARAIGDMLLRGAPLIGVAAAYGYALAAKGRGKSPQAVLARLEREGKRLMDSRPTAVNLSYAVRRMEAKAQRLTDRGRVDLYGELLQEARAIHREDLDMNRRIAKAGAALLGKGSAIMTHCNAGALATSGIGTALGVVRRAHALGRIRRVYSCETRPYLQGSRLTLWELMREGIPATLITDNMAAHLMATERIDAVIVGADRIAANADVANKIGTYGLAILARHHRVPFLVAAPSTTVDLSIPDGSHIPIEERSGREVLEVFGKSIAPPGAVARHPAFDVTPHSLLTAIITEKGVVSPANGRRLKSVLAS